MVYLIIIISLVLDGILSNLLFNTIFVPIFSIVSISILYPYITNKNKYLVISFCMGLFYDIVYTSSPFVNACSFLLVALIVVFIYHYITSTLLNSIALNACCLIIYRIITYFILYLFDYISFDFNFLFKGIYSSILVNIFYGIAIYYLCSYISKKQIQNKKKTNFKKLSKNTCSF